jgi:hypothetical protein
MLTTQAASREGLQLYEVHRNIKTKAMSNRMSSQAVTIGLQPMGRIAK